MVCLTSSNVVIFFLLFLINDCLYLTYFYCYANYNNVGFNSVWLFEDCGNHWGVSKVFAVYKNIHYLGI